MKPLAFLVLTLFCCMSGYTQSKKIKFDYDGHLYVTGRLNDSIAGRFIFDTGAGMTILDSSFLMKSITPQKVFNVNINGLGEKRLQGRYTTDTLRFWHGDFQTLCNAAVFTDLPKMLPLECDGLLSVNHFDTIYGINYQKGEISILPSVDSLSGYTKIPYKTTDSNGFIEFGIEVVIDSAGGKVLKEFVHLDTGNPGTVDFKPDAKLFKKYSRQLGRTTSVALATVGIGGGGSKQVFEMQGVRLGGHFVKAESGAIITNAANKDKKSKASTGIIGNSIMDHFDIVIDRRAKNLYIRPNNTFDTPIPASYSGAYISRLGYPDRLVVNGLNQGYKGPLRQGDIITHIDNKEALGFTFKELETYLCTPDRCYTLTITRGNETLKLNITNLNKQTLWQ